LRRYTVERDRLVGNDSYRHGDYEGALRQGLTLVHISAQLEPFLTQNTP
jgi:hypothetical protein